MAYTGDKKREYQREWVAARRSSYLVDKSCEVCGSSEELEVDHIDRSKKWKHSIWSYSWERIYAELEKCQILCKTHHRDKTNVELGAYEHGSKSMYNNHHCRCDGCREGHKLRRRRERQRAGMAGIGRR